MKKGANHVRLLIVMAILAGVWGCAPRPRLYPNATLRSRGPRVAEADINRCLRDADAYLASPKGRQIARGAGYGAVVGGVVGAVSGLFSGDVGKGAAEGAAMGGVGGGTAGALSPDQVKRNYVNQCLSDMGYQVMGWN